MSLRDQDNPIVVIRKEEGEVEREPWVKDNKVVAYEDRGHILCDLASTQVLSQGECTWIRLEA